MSRPKSHWFIYLKKFFFLGLLICLSAAFFYFHLHEYLSLDTLKKYQETVQTWSFDHYKSAISIYIFLYIILIACAIPCATLLTLLGGFLFGDIAVIYALLSTTLGGTFLFLAVRTAIGSRLTAKSSGWISRMEQGFRKNAFNYLLMLRLVPVFPCWISNIAAGALNVPIKTFVFATIIGIFPSTFIYVLAGQSLDKLLTNDNMPLFSIILTPSVLFPLIGLAILSLFPVIYRYIKNHSS